MPIRSIPINKGVFKTQHDRALRNSEFAEELVNLFVDEAGGNLDRPALASFATVSSIIPIGMRWFNNLLVVVTTDRKVYTVDSTGAVTDVTGTTLPGINRPTFADDGDTLIIAGGAAPLKWTGPGTTTALLGGSPPNITHVVYLDGYIIGNRRLDSENNKVIQFSEVDDPETWTGTNIFSNVADPDETQGITVSQRELYAVGENTTEIWQNIGTSPVPFARAYTWNYGTPAPYSIISEDNSVFFLTGNRQILRFVGRAPQRISEPIEHEISTYNKIDDCFSSSFPWKGSIHVLFVWPTEQKAWSVDLKNNQWSEWKGYSTDGFGRVRINCLEYAESTQTTYVGDYDTGSVYTFSDTTKTDAGQSFKRKRRFSYTDGGASVRKQANMVRVNLDRDVASSFTGEASSTNPTLELRWRDDGKDWSDWRQSSLGQIGELKHYAEFHRLGIYRTRQYELQFADPSALQIVSVETDEEVMAS